MLSAMPWFFRYVCRIPSARPTLPRLWPTNGRFANGLRGHRRTYSGNWIPPAWPGVWNTIFIWVPNRRTGVPAFREGVD